MIMIIMMTLIMIILTMILIAAAPGGDLQANRELEYGIHRLHSPVNSLRSLETFGDVCKNKTSFL